MECLGKKQRLCLFLYLSRTLSSKQEVDGASNSLLGTNCFLELATNKKHKLSKIPHISPTSFIVVTGLLWRRSHIFSCLHKAEKRAGQSLVSLSVLGISRGQMPWKFLSASTCKYILAYFGPKRFYKSIFLRFSTGLREIINA